MRHNYGKLLLGRDTLENNTSYPSLLSCCGSGEHLRKQNKQPFREGEQECARACEERGRRVSHEVILIRRGSRPLPEGIQISAPTSKACMLFISTVSEALLVEGKKCGLLSLGRKIVYVT